MSKTIENSDTGEKDHFFEFGIKNKDDAEKWKFAIEESIKYSIAQRELLTSQDKRRRETKKDIGNTPATVQALLDGDKFSDNEPFLSSDQSVESETVWRILSIDSGLRILKEYPRNDELSASQIFKDADSHNSILLYSFCVSIFVSVIIGASTQGPLVVLISGVSICLLAFISLIRFFKFEFF